jgi:hypothetical protein
MYRQVIDFLTPFGFADEHLGLAPVDSHDINLHSLPRQSDPTYSGIKGVVGAAHVQRPVRHSFKVAATKERNVR